ncbi:mRNA-decapping enzyme 1B-like isoform X2 [Amphibalanus amphitrite]|nr:mRNA-decapping enzyme 1B-like [Amphibalanus amphitrite]XP_043247687.1 mRNA-decapping enzyme 1B-like isoform X2 [Amphibalanus amphitrite]XP_043247688.1 mRNA-decapping enzyme 1B-like isoform X2 [Amphibalanus amphitrite]XP_043247689.1 mRNA-decapping enzyme 1B-like isoform X2 [Amphibalanus amphitrite]XP_043247690.1 mRNA-decapping enzyme 1B-like isoform X2 [Amphibalanus amphitrite]XP_043247691.1 mRNA-decapping enzyme 1B-like isoform X2 [Amphibalanus amphitrite]XP_043247693.1 mRNA-decapping enzy
MADRVNSQQMNLTAVRRHDPYVEDIVDSATQVAVYEYSSETSEWQKTDMQGALFVYKRTGPPYHSFMVLNRLNTSNLLQPLTGELEFQLQAPFLLYRTSQGIIYGLWFFYEAQCKRMAGLLESLCQSSAGGGGAPGSNKNSSIDLLTLFKSASGPQPSQQQPQQQQLTPQKPVKGQQQRQPPAGAAGSGSRPETPRDDPAPPPTQAGQISIADLFAKASRTGQVLIGKQTARSISVSEVEDAMPDLGGRPRLPAQPPPPPVISAAPPSGAAAVRPAAPVREAESRDVDRIQELFKNNLQLGGAEPPAAAPAPAPAPAPSPSPAVSHQTAAFASPVPVPDLTAPVGSGVSVTLMSPMMFSALAPPSVDLGSSAGAGDRAAPPAAPSPLLADPAPVGDGDLTEVTPLTRRQLLQAFNYLLKNDDAFLGQLHEAYVKSLTESFRRT